MTKPQILWKSEGDRFLLLVDGDRCVEFEAVHVVGCNAVQVSRRVCSRGRKSEWQPLLPAEIDKHIELGTPVGKWIQSCIDNRKLLKRLLKRYARFFRNIDIDYESKNRIADLNLIREQNPNLYWYE